LNISSEQEKNSALLKKVIYQQKHIDTIALYNEVLKIETHLKAIGYYSVLIKKVLIQKDTTFATYSLGEKIETALLSIDSTHFGLLKKLTLKKGLLKIPAANLEATLLNISKELDVQGHSFSEVSLKNTKIKDAVLYADVHLLKSKKRNINSIVVKGYEEFPKSYVEHFLKINTQTLFTKAKLKDISKRLQSIPFITQTKPIETLFKKDSTMVYLFVKKKQKNRFDGLLNFNTNETGAVQLNGYLDLKLINILNRGEELTLLWNRFDKERQELNLKTQIPFIYNSPISSSLEFSLYKQDSTFLNAQFNTDFSLFLNEKLQLAVNYDYVSSKTSTAEGSTSEAAAFTSQFIGASIHYNLPMNDLFSNQKATIMLNPTIGQRKASEGASRQFKIDFFASYIFEISPRNSLYIANKTGYLNSDHFLQNELYRIGGAKSLRGFNEQSLFASKFSFLNIEYRFLTSTKSFIYTITDFGQFAALNSVKKAFSIGVGYQFITNNSQINLNYALGKTDTQTIDYKSSKLNISFVTFF
jgi:hypothetical protein